MKPSLKLILSALVVGALVLFLPMVLGTGPSTNAVTINTSGFGLVLTLGGIFLAGILTALTPCVYPLIPITMSVFGVKKDTGRAQALTLTLTYMLGIALMYTTMGTVFAALGKTAGSAMGSPYVLVPLSIIFTVLALSMFGGWNMQLPSGLQTKLSSAGGKGYMGALIMGLVAGIVAAPCTGPALGAILGFVAKERNIPFGALLLFIYSLGIGFPFFLIGAFSVKLPKSGAWMDAVKSIFGIALLALVIMYLRDAFPAFRRFFTFEYVAYGALIATVLAVVGMLLGAVKRSFYDGADNNFIKVLAVVLVIAGVSLRPHAPVGELNAWKSDATQVVAAAAMVKEPVAIYFDSKDCVSCDAMRKTTLSNPEFVDDAKQWQLVRVDATNPSDTQVSALMAKYDVKSTPAFVFVSNSGAARKFEGYADNQELKNWLQGKAIRPEPVPAGTAPTPTPNPTETVDAPTIAVWHPAKELDQTLADALGKKGVIIDFGAEWCAACKELEKITFKDKAFMAEIGKWNLARIDCTKDDDPAVVALQKKYGANDLPTVILIDKDGKVREDLTVKGFEKADAFVARMKKVMP